MKVYVLAIILCAAAGCLSMKRSGPPIIPAEEFSKALRNGTVNQYSFTRLGKDAAEPANALPEQEPPASPLPQSLPAAGKAQARAQLSGDPRLLAAGYELKQSMPIPSPQIRNEAAAPLQTVSLAGQPASPPPGYPAPPPGSSAPYLAGQMTANPSLWPDEAQGAYLFSDYRAFQAMDVITIVINEDTKGQKKAETDAESKYSLLAAIENFFGIETEKWARNNASLDPTALINAKTETKFEGDAETKRSGTLKAKISAVIMEVFPNGLMRIEGTKIVSIDSEEEIIVISGLVRARDIDSDNQVDSSRIANMRIDLYGQGLLAEHNKPGWGARLFEIVWPF